MITYDSGYFGLKILGQIHGSAVYRSVVPALVSTLFLIIVATAWPGSHWHDGNDNNNGSTLHPYTITIYVNAFSLLLTFRLNFSYQRYWEAATQLFNMICKWSDAATCLSAFHYQQMDLYDDHHLPSFAEVEASRFASEIEEIVSVKDDNDDDDGMKHERYNRRRPVDGPPPPSHSTNDDPPSPHDDNPLSPSSRLVQPTLRAAVSAPVTTTSAAGGGGAVGREDIERNNNNNHRRQFRQTGRDDSSGPFLLKRWLQSFEGQQQRRRLRKSRSSSNSNSNNSNRNSIDSRRSGSVNHAHVDEQQSSQGFNDDVSSAASSQSFVQHANGNIDVTQQFEETKDHANTPLRNDSSTSATSSSTKPKVQRISKLAAVTEGLPSLFAQRTNEKDPNPFQGEDERRKTQRRRRQTMPAIYSSPPMDVNWNETRNHHGDNQHRHQQSPTRHVSADDLDNTDINTSDDNQYHYPHNKERDRLAARRKTDRISKIIQRHEFQIQPHDFQHSFNDDITEERDGRYGGMTSDVSTSSSSPSSNKKPQTLHRRVPSADVPQPYETIRSFQPASSTFERRKYIGVPTSGLHRRSNYVRSVSNSRIGRPSTTLPVAGGGGGSNMSNIRTLPATLDGTSSSPYLAGVGRRGSTSAAVTFTGIDATPMPGIGGNAFGVRHYDPAEGLSAHVFENDAVHNVARRRRSSFQVPIEENSQDFNVRRQIRRRSSLPSLKGRLGNTTHIDSTSIEDIFTTSNSDRGPTRTESRTRSGRIGSFKTSESGERGSKTRFSTDSDTQQESINTASTPASRGDRSPSLFLQEAAHLLSLTSAVAMASLRADMEGVSSPLVEYIPGLQFPPVNPDEIQNTTLLVVAEESAGNDTDSSARSTHEKSGESSSQIKSDVDSGDNGQGNKLQRVQIQPHFLSNSGFWRATYFLFGLTRSPRQRTLYNATRPFTVLGGISDHEVNMLQQARGPEAQMALCGLWFKEFISREYLHGSTGEVAGPILSRIYQFYSDGNTQYNQCRKIAYIQFPFPQAQLTIFFLFVSLVMFPYLYYSYVNSPVIACILNFMTTVCFVGQQEVARELQDPFYQYPNDLPLNNYQAQFNEALISSMFTGFHPDFTNNDMEDFLHESSEGDSDGDGIHEVMKSGKNRNPSRTSDSDELTPEEMNLISEAAVRSSRPVYSMTP